MKISQMRAQLLHATVTGDHQRAERLREAIKKKKNEQEKPRPLGDGFKQMIKKFNNN